MKKVNFSWNYLQANMLDDNFIKQNYWRQNAWLGIHGTVLESVLSHCTPKLHKE